MRYLSKFMQVYVFFKKNNDILISNFFLFSVGVGRMGIYCVLDYLFQFVDEYELDEFIDIFDLVMNF